MKTFFITLLFALSVFVCSINAQTKLKVAYPTTVGSMAVIWVTIDAKLFE
jgi:hypothetical protein